MRMKFEDLKESSVEEWAKLLDSEPKKTPLPKEHTEQIFYLMVDKEVIEESENTQKFFTECCVAKVFSTRIRACHDYEITKTGMVFLLLAFSNFTFATSTMIANYLQYISKIKCIKRFDIDILARDIFPLGVFSEKTLNEAWELQKVEADTRHPNDNMLDYSFCCKSINSR